MNLFMNLQNLLPSLRIATALQTSTHRSRAGGQLHRASRHHRGDSMYLCLPCAHGAAVDWLLQHMRMALQVKPSTTPACSGVPLRSLVQEPAQPGSSIALSISGLHSKPCHSDMRAFFGLRYAASDRSRKFSRCVARGCRLLCLPCHWNTQVFFGLQFAAGDRILTSVQEYGSNYINFLQVTRCITISNHMLCESDL